MLYVNQQKLLHMLQLCTHKEVVDTITKQVDNDMYFTVRNDNDGWCAIIPKNIDTVVPALCVHTDTVFKHPPKEVQTDGPVWSSADPAVGLGADDRAGCYIVKELITRGFANYIYLIFDQEEVGGVGSHNFTRADEFPFIDKQIGCYIGLDRRGLNQMALYGYESDTFKAALHDEHWKFTSGTFTDCSVLADATDKCCVNLSVGYDNEHTKRETLNLSYLGVTLNKVAFDLSGPLMDSVWPADDKSMYYGDGLWDEFAWCDTRKDYVPVSELYDENFEDLLESDDFLTRGI